MQNERDRIRGEIDDVLLRYKAGEITDRKRARKIILNIKGLAVLSDYQELPEMLESDYGILPYSLNPYSYDAAQQDMLKFNFKRVIKEE